MIKRTIYLEKIIPFIDKPLIKAIVGVRRSGKTVLLTQICDIIKARGVKDEQIIYMNFESFKVVKYLNGMELYQYVIDKYNEGKENKLYLFFDEIQDVFEWEKVLASLLVDISCDIYITGSNSKLLSGELATHIAGRHIHVNVYPFNFSECKEYAHYLGREITDEALFEEYLTFGGLPQCCGLNDPHSKRAYLEDIFNTVVINDIVERNRLTDTYLLKRLISFLLDNVGNPFSATSICKALKGDGLQISVTTVLNYVSYVTRSLIIGQVQRYDIKGKALLTTSEKYYSADLGIRNCIKCSNTVDYSKLFENAVYLEMLSRGYEVTVGKTGEYEIDFICHNTSGEKIYIQVAYLLSDPATVQREFRPFEYVTDNYPKYVISADRLDFSQNGIKHYNVIDFLLRKDK